MSDAILCPHYHGKPVAAPAECRQMAIQSACAICLPFICLVARLASKSIHWEMDSFCEYIWKHYLLCLKNISFGSINLNNLGQQIYLNQTWENTFVVFAHWHKAKVTRQSIVTLVLTCYYVLAVGNNRKHDKIRLNDRTDEGYEDDVICSANQSE